MPSMFLNATVFNGNISTWDTSSLKFLFGAFNGAIAFNQDLSSWNVSSATFLPDMFLGATNFSAANYDKLLATWSQQNIQSNVSFGAPPTYYCNVTARNVFVNTFGWTISGDTGEGTAEQCTP